MIALAIFAALHIGLLSYAREARIRRRLRQLQEG